jgi:hypothetical protein
MQNVGNIYFGDARPLGVGWAEDVPIASRFVAPVPTEGWGGVVPRGSLGALSPALYVGAVVAVRGYGGAAAGVARMQPLYNPAYGLGPIPK